MPVMDDARLAGKAPAGERSRQTPFSDSSCRFLRKLTESRPRLGSIRTRRNGEEGPVYACVYALDFGIGPSGPGDRGTDRPISADIHAQQATPGSDSGQVLPLG